MECKALSAYQKKNVRKETSDPGFRARLVGRIVWQRMQLGQEWYHKEIESLKAHEEDIVLPNQLSPVLDYLCGSIEDGDLDMLSKLAKLGIASLEELRIIFRRARTNFLKVPKDKNVAKVLCSEAVTLSHSCDPNVAFATPESTAVTQNFLHIIALKNIKPGEELTRSYILNFHPYLLRQAHLRVYAYITECRCALCVKNKLAIEGKSSRVDPREALWCGRPDCTGWVALDWSEISKPKPKGLCSGCKQPCILNADQVADTIKRAKEKWESVRIRGGRSPSLPIKWCKFI